VEVKKGSNPLGGSEKFGSSFKINILDKNRQS
jgi:hypothetical protein